MTSNKVPPVNIAERVTGLEVGMKTLSAHVDQVAGSIERLSNTVNVEFAAIRKDGKPNWGWIFSALAVTIAIIGAIGAAWVYPLRQADDVIRAELEHQRQETKEASDRAARLEERLRVYRELGVFDSPRAQREGYAELNAGT